MTKIRRLFKRSPKKSDSTDAPNKWKDRIVPVAAVVVIIGLVVAFAKIPALQLDATRQLPSKAKASVSPVLPVKGEKRVWFDEPAKMPMRRTDIVTRQ